MTAPTKLADAVGTSRRAVRCATPGCTNEVLQFRFGSTWAPTLCPQCSAAREAAVMRDEAEQKEAERRRKALEALDVPLLYERATLDNFQIAGDDADRKKQARVLQLARRYLAMWEDRQNTERLEFPQVVIFSGAPGTGKGHVAWAIARTVAVDFGDSVVFTVLSDCIRDLREAWHQRPGEGPSESARLARYRRAALLIVDEVSDHAFFGQPTQHLYDLVAWREARLLPTILTTNHAGDGLGGVLGPALLSRAAGWSGVWEFGERDYRSARREARLAASREGR